MSFIRRKTVSGLKAGDSFSITRTFTAAEVDRFAAITRDYNPIHFDERFTAVKQFSGLICHGLLVGGMVTEIGGQIGWLASGMSFEFRKPVYIGDTIECTLTIHEVNQKGYAVAEAVFTNQDKAVVITSSLTGYLPGNREKQVMQDMMAEGDPTNRIGYD